MPQGVLEQNCTLLQNPMPDGLARVPVSRLPESLSWGRNQKAGQVSLYVTPKPSPLSDTTDDLRAWMRCVLALGGNIPLLQLPSILSKADYYSGARGPEKDANEDPKRSHLYNDNLHAYLCLSAGSGKSLCKSLDNSFSESTTLADNWLRLAPWPMLWPRSLRQVESFASHSLAM